MKNILLVVIILGFCKFSFAQLRGTVQQVTFTGAETKKSITFSIYLPPGYALNLSKKYPVIYHMHGANQTHNGPHTTAVPLAFEAANTAGHWDEGIIVFPDGYLNTMWADSYDWTKPLMWQRPPGVKKFDKNKDNPDLAIRKGNFILLINTDGLNPELYDVGKDES